MFLLSLYSYVIGLRVKETKEVYEGELTELTPAETENPLSGYGKTVSRVIIGLKTVKGTKQLRLDPTIYESILKEKIVVGDVVYVEQNTGAVKVSSCILHYHSNLSVPFSLSESVAQTHTPPPTTSNPKPSSPSQSHSPYSSPKSPYYTLPSPP